MRTKWFLLSFVVLFAAQNSLAEDDIGEISDDNFDAPPLMNTRGEEKQSTTKGGLAVKKEEKTEEEAKKEGNATGSVEKGEKTGGRVDEKKASFLTFTITPSGSNEDAEKEIKKALKATGLAQSGEKSEKETTKADKKTVLPKSEEKAGKEAPVGQKIVMVTSSDKEKKEKEEKVNPSKTIITPSSEKITKVTGEGQKVSTSSSGNKESAEKTEKKEEEKPVDADQETTLQKETTTVVTTVNVPLIEDSGEKKGEMVDGEGEGASDEQEEPEGEQVTGEKEEEKKEEKKDERLEGIEGKRPYPKEPINAEYYSNSHFFSFFIFFIIISAVGYLAYHNKRKIMALLIEGRSGKGGRVRYHRLANDDNFERNVIY